MRLRVTYSKRELLGDGPQLAQEKKRQSCRNDAAQRRKLHMQQEAEPRVQSSLWHEGIALTF